jgi:uncharacterized protein (DUF1501 family)
MTTSSSLSMPSRRRWLQRSALGLAGAFGTGSLLNLMAARPAQAADYKALVCIFLYGGNDGMNMIVPTDATRYGQYAGVRRNLALPQSSLLPLAGTSYGLHPALSALQSVWNAGRLAPVFNLGPLVQPLTKAQYRALSWTSPALPESLFSHSDQQVLWETGSGSSFTRTGWGGRACDTLATVNPVISIGGNGRFGIQALQGPLVLPGPGATFGANGMQPADLQWGPSRQRKAALDVLYAEANVTALGSDFSAAYARQQRDAFAVSQRLGAIVKAMPGGASTAIDAGFAPIIANGQISNGLGKQLYQIAKLIEANATVGGSRQIFFAQLGGFDTHGNQIGNDVLSGEHADLLRQLGGALGAFDAAMTNLGLGANVTSFTQSDFGRTFAPNNSRGTDHAWGNHHLVLGGAVRGGTTYGRYPELVLGGADDVGVNAWELQGRWIPTSSVDQYAATLLRWFGAAETQLDTILPNLARFGTARGLGFV